MRRRSGITLIEVLVAIFIMAIGLLALLTLFPLAALNMSRALENDRAASSASAAANLCDGQGLRTWPGFNTYYVNPPWPNFPPALPTGPGYPLYIDAYGSANGSGPAVGASTLTTPATPGVPRIAPPPPWSNPAQFFTLLDDATFDKNGLPSNPDGLTVVTPGSVKRADRYTWAYLLRRTPVNSPTAPVELIIVVYAGRATAVPGGENTFAVAPNGGGNQNSTALVLNWDPTIQKQPAIRRGSWIFDTSYNIADGSVHGDFYRVVSVNVPSANTMNLELQTPLSKTVTAVTVLDNVVEVFERGLAPSNQWP